MGTSAYYAPASSAVAMARSYLLDHKRILAGAAYLDGEYGYKDLFMGVPVVIGGKGVEKIIDIPLTEAEKEMLAKSAKSVQAVVDHLQEGVTPLAVIRRPKDSTPFALNNPRRCGKGCCVAVRAACCRTETPPRDGS